MTLAELWDALQLRAPEHRDGRMIQRIHPTAKVDLFVTVELERGRARHALELQVSDEALAICDIPTSTLEVELSVEKRGSGSSALVLALDDPSARDLFAAMCEDIAALTALSATEEGAIDAWCERFTKWRRMLRPGGEGLSQRRQRGLFAELLMIRDHLVRLVGFDEAIRAWKGPDGAPRDFEIGGYGVEVKSSAANEPQVVLIHGERQLDDAGLTALVLFHLSLEVLRDAGTTLPDLVAELRETGAQRQEGGTLEDRLDQSGYADVEEPFYRRTGYMLRRTSAFHVQGAFPRITEGDLVDGVGAVRYSLAIEACRSFEVPLAFLDENLKKPAK